MSLKDIPIKTGYETQGNGQQLMDEFYIPVLQEANKYYRIAGYFSSSALAVAAKGIEGLIHNDGKMYLLISPELSEEDFKVISEHQTITAEADIFSALNLEHAVDENLQALAWLLDCGRLEIKIVVSKKSRNSLFHQKVGIVFDSDGNMISFSGSINESAQAWLSNIEEFKVFRSWEFGQEEYLTADYTKFLDYWNDKRNDVAKVFDIPEAIHKKLVSIKPRNIEDLNIMRRYQKNKNVSGDQLSLFPHQKAAVEKWVENNQSLLMEMATGTGKTRTAIGCLVELLKRSSKILCIVSTPQNTLSRQWKEELLDLNVALDYIEIVDGSVPKWKSKLELLLYNIDAGKYKNAIIFTTHDTSSSDNFIDIIKNTKYDTEIFFICDEVHAIGSLKQRNALLSEYDYRLGLSATPERMFDEEGTELIKNYFGNKSYEFTISDALREINPLTGKPFLNPFDYQPVFVTLTDWEQAKYDRLSSQIAIMISQDDYDEDELLMLYNRRANISKNAENKFNAFEQILDSPEMGKIQDMILFVTDKQIDRCFDILSDRQIKRAKITEHESASKIVNGAGETERQALIAQFQRHELQVLVGMKCLDEGIDITNARIAVLMASSTNPREYVQRVGRVIRPGPEKEKSVIYDLIVFPENESKSGTGVLAREIKRANQIAKDAINYGEVKKLFLEKGVILDAD